MGELTKLPNIGKVVEKQLNDVGIFTAEQLREEGSKKAWLKIKNIDDSACINRLYALEGAIKNIKSNLICEQKKQELRNFYIIHK